MRENLIQQKSYDFAVKIVCLYRHLATVQKEYILSRQLLRSGTSIAANVEEAIGGSSRADFAAKIGIAYKEARETRYWLRLMKDTGYLAVPDFDRLWPAAEELCRILGAIRATTRTRHERQRRTANLPAHGQSPSSESKIHDWSGRLPIVHR